MNEVAIANREQALFLRRRAMCERNCFSASGLSATTRYLRLIGARGENRIVPGNLGVSVTENLDPWQPRQPPLKPAIRLQVSIAKYAYGIERRFAVEQLVEHLKAFCTAVVETCASEENIVMAPFDTQRAHPPTRTEIGRPRPFERFVSAVGFYVDIGLPYPS